MSFDKEIKRILLESPQIINDDLLLEVYQYQYACNSVYKEFADAVHKSPALVKNVSQIHFYPFHSIKNTTLKRRMAR